MRTSKDHAIIMSRTDYGERDRILTLLGESEGKMSVLAKGVRAQKSRLAGGIELLCESEITFVDTRSNLKTLTGARLSIHFSELVKDMVRMQHAFSAIKTINDISEEGGGQEYYQPLLTVFVSLNDATYDPRLVDIWFNLLILRESGSEPNLHTDEEDDRYEFNYDSQQFISRPGGPFTQNDLKLLRLCLKRTKPIKINKPLGSEDRLQALLRSLVMNILN